MCKSNFWKMGKLCGCLHQVTNNLLLLGLVTWPKVVASCFHLFNMRTALLSHLMVVGFPTTSTRARGREYSRGRMFSDRRLFLLQGLIVKARVVSLDFFHSFFM